MQLAAYGRLGQDPKEIKTSTGTVMAVASIAVTLQDRTGAEHTQWLGLVAFGKVAESLLKHSKGELVSASGRVQFNSYTANGEKREELQIVADSIVSAKSVRPNGGRRKTERSSSTREQSDGEPFDDRITF